MKPLEPGDPREIGGIRLLGRLGSGGFGTVYLGVSSLGRWVAVKVLHLPNIDLDLRKRFAREAKASMQVDSPYVAQVTEASISGNPPYLVSEYIPGPTLAETRADFRALTTDEFYALAAGLSGGLSDLHARGIVHRDLKPANIILSESGPVLVDLGIATADGGTAITQQGMVAGTPNWMSPEQVDGFAATPASDIWALGRCLRWVGQQHGVLLGATNAMQTLISEALSDDPLLRPSAATFKQRIIGEVNLDEFIAPRWTDIKANAINTSQQLPTIYAEPGDAQPTAIAESFPTAIDRQHESSVDQQLYSAQSRSSTTPVPPSGPWPAPNPDSPRRSSGLKWAAGILAAVLFIVVVIGTVFVGTQIISRTDASNSGQNVEIPSAPTPTVTVTQDPNGNPQPQSPSDPTVTVFEDADPNAPQGGEQDLIYQLASAMNSQNWPLVNSLCEPTQTCEVQFTGFFAPRYTRGQWVDTSFDTFYSCRGNVPYGMERGCTTPDRWVGDIFFTCFKDGAYGFQEELTSFTFTYVNGYPQIQRFDPVALITRADECY